MGAHPFDPSFEALPAELAIFPLAGALVLPGGVLPLNIFEPRYLNMTLDALGNGRLIGMIQPDETADEEGLYDVGCAGRITAFQETDDGRLLINLTGVCRFRVADELTLCRGYRRILPDWRDYALDLQDADGSEVDSTQLISAATRYFESNDIQGNWQSLVDLSKTELTNFLAMHLPFAPRDKQAMLEADTVVERARSLIALTEMALASSQPGVRH